MQSSSAEVAVVGSHEAHQAQDAHDTSRELIDSTLPLCSFGPGGAYVVDWVVREEDLEMNRRASSPRTIGSLIGRFAGWIARDLKGWLIADHPRRVHRIDWHADSLEPCVVCGTTSSWPRSFVAAFTGVKEETTFAATSEATTTAVAGGEMEESGIWESSDDQMVFPFPKSQDIEMVENFAASPAGALLMRLAATSRGARQQTGHRDLKQSESPELALNTEYSHDTDTQATENPHRDSGLPSSQRVLPDNAGARRSTRRFQGHNLRARRSARTKGPYSSGPEQGSLFGNLADGQAA